MLISFNAKGLRTDQLDTLRFSEVSIANAAHYAGPNATLPTPWGAFMPSATLSSRQASLVYSALLVVRLRRIGALASSFCAVAVDFTIIVLFLVFAIFVQLLMKRGTACGFRCGIANPSHSPGLLVGV